MDHCGRSDLGGKQTWRPEHNGMAAVPKSRLRSEVAERVAAGRRPSFPRGEGRCRWGSNGHGHPTDRRDMGPGIQEQTHGDNVGKGHGPAGWRQPAKTSRSRETGGGGRAVVRRMSPSERGGRGNALRRDGEHRAVTGNAGGGQRGSGHWAASVPERCADSEPRDTVSSGSGRGHGQTGGGWGECARQRLSLLAGGKARGG